MNVILEIIPGQSPTAWRLPSCLGPEICESEQRQIRQLDHRCPWVTRMSSPHLPETATLWNSSSRRQHFINASPVFASMLVGVHSGSNQKWATWHSAIFLALSFQTLDDWELPLQRPSSFRRLWRSFSSSATHMMGLCAVCSLPGKHGRWASCHSDLTFGFAHSGHLLTSRPTHPFYAELVLMRRWRKFCDPVALKRTVLERNQWEISF